MTIKIRSFSTVTLLVATNIITATLFVLIFFKEGYPKRLLSKLKHQETNIEQTGATQQQLAAMNNTFHPTYTDFSIGNSKKLFKILILGNSLTTHPVAENIGWTHQSGMAATNIKKDYVHLLLAKLANRLPNKKIIFRVANFADFERNPNNLLPHSIDSLSDFKPDIIVFQLGENVKEENIHLFQNKYSELITTFKKSGNPTTVCTTPFFPSLSKNYMVDSVAIKTHSFEVDLSNLVLIDRDNYAINESNYQGDKTKWKVSGIGMHPGDKGMQNIAEKLFIAVNGIITK